MSTPYIGLKKDCKFVIYLELFILHENSDPKIVIADYVRRRLVTIIGLLGRITGLGTPCCIICTPQALQMGFPWASRRHKEVIVVWQLLQDKFRIREDLRGASALASVLVSARELSIISWRNQKKASSNIIRYRRRNY